MLNCTVCRDTLPADCPGCGVVELKQNNQPDIPEQQIVDEIFREIGDERDYEYYPGCYEG